MIKTLKLLVCLGICLAAGCSDSPDDAASGTFHVTADTLIDSDTAAVLHVTIEARGKRPVEVYIDGKLFCKTASQPADDTDTFRFELKFVAVMVKRPASLNTVTWYIRAEYPATGVECPAMVETEAQKLSEILKLNTFERWHPFGEDLVLGEFRQSPIVVLLK